MFLSILTPLAEKIGGGVVSFSTVVASVKYWLKRRDAAKEREAAGSKAMQQIDHMATNCFPTMQKNLEMQTKLLEKHTELLEKHNDALADIGTNIKVLVDRGQRL